MARSVRNGSVQCNIVLYNWQSGTADSWHARISRDDFDAVIFNLDGVVTHTNKAHAAAWKQTLDSFLIKRDPQDGEDLAPFHIELDYRRYLDGKPRDAGIKHFLSARHIKPAGESSEDLAYTKRVIAC